MDKTHRQDLSTVIASLEKELGRIKNARNGLRAMNKQAPEEAVSVFQVMLDQSTEALVAHAQQLSVVRDQILGKESAHGNPVQAATNGHSTSP